MIKIPLNRLGHWVTGDPRELTYELARFRRFADASRLACRQQTHCGMHACIDFHTYSNDHPSRQSGLCMSGVRSRTNTRGDERNCRSVPAVLKLLRASKGWINWWVKLHQTLKPLTSRGISNTVYLTSYLYLTSYPDRVCEVYFWSFYGNHFTINIRLITTAIRWCSKQSCNLCSVSFAIHVHSREE